MTTEAGGAVHRYVHTEDGMDLATRADDEAGFETYVTAEVFAAERAAWEAADEVSAGWERVAAGYQANNATAWAHAEQLAAENGRLTAEIAAMRARADEVEVACAQAVEFAEYVQSAAKGAMVERAKHFLSLPYSQELAARLKDGAAMRAQCEGLATALRWIRDRIEKTDGKHGWVTFKNIDGAEACDWIDRTDARLRTLASGSAGGEAT